jgi:hypothetical protein
VLKRVVAVALAYGFFLVPHLLVTVGGTNWIAALWHRPWLFAVYTLPALAVADRIYRRISRSRAPNDPRSAARAKENDEGSKDK